MGSISEEPFSVQETATTKSFIPATPMSLREVGVNRDIIIHLLIKVLYFSGEVTGAYLANRLRLPFTIIDEFIEFIKNERLCEVKGMSGIGRPAYRYSISSLGRDRAREFLEINQYTGPTPVPLEQYTDFVKTMSASRSYITQETIAREFRHLVLSKQMLDMVGPAVNSGKSMFVYGAPGNGKTVVSETIGRMLGGEIYIPHAIDIDGMVVTIYDPINHKAFEGVKIPDEEGVRSPLLNTTEELMISAGSSACGHSYLLEGN